eukprot:scaffold12543_cov115-Isochrysis_galbana.AAC.2
MHVGGMRLPTLSGRRLGALRKRSGVRVSTQVAAGLHAGKLEQLSRWHGVSPAHHLPVTAPCIGACRTLPTRRGATCASRAAQRRPVHARAPPPSFRLL